MKLYGLLVIKDALETHAESKQILNKNDLCSITVTFYGKLKYVALNAYANVYTMDFELKRHGAELIGIKKSAHRTKD
jgi:hypothetical protein